jgi:hypothetical protein
LSTYSLFSSAGWSTATSILITLCSFLLLSGKALANDVENCKNEVFTVEVTECRDIPTYPNLPRLEINGMNVTPFLERFREPLMVRDCFTRQQQELRCVPESKPTVQ